MQTFKSLNEVQVTCPPKTAPKIMLESQEHVKGD